VHVALASITRVVGALASAYLDHVAATDESIDTGADRVKRICPPLHLEQLVGVELTLGFERLPDRRLDQLRGLPLVQVDHGRRLVEAPSGAAPDALPGHRRASNRLVASGNHSSASSSAVDTR